MPTFSVVIPTRQRARTLREAIPTVLAQTDGDFELIVQDNPGSAQARAVAEGFGDPRIVYRGADRLLAMHDNWEAALAHARGDWIIFIGDDDALLPDALAQARRIIAESDARLLTWVAAVYGWPCHNAPAQRDFISVLLGRGWEETFSRPVLRELYARRRTWLAAPSIYHGFVHRSVVETARARSGGRYFVDMQPDIGASLTNLFCVERFVKSLEPLSVTGWSGDSNGGRDQTHEGMRRTLERLATEAGRSIRSWTVVSDPRLAGIETMMLATLANVRAALGATGDPGIAADTAVPTDERGVLSSLIRDPAGITVSFEEWREAVLEHAGRLGLAVDPASLTPPPPPRRATGLDVDREGRIRQIQADARRLGCASLGDAVRWIAALLRAYRDNPAAARTSAWPDDPVARRGDGATPSDRGAP